MICVKEYIYIYSYTYRYISSRRGTYGGTARKEEKNGERETRLTQGGFWLIGQTYKFVATYPWITWGPGTLVGPRTSVPFLRENATHRGTRPRPYLRHRPEASFLTADRTRATRAYAMRLVQPPLLSFFLSYSFVYFLACFVCSPSCTWILLSSTHVTSGCLEGFCELMSKF